MSFPFQSGQQIEAAMKDDAAGHKQTLSGSSSHRIHSGTDHASTVFEDSGFFENEYTNTPRKDYQDFVLFDNTHHTTIYTGDFFADVHGPANGSVDANQGSIYDERHSDPAQVGQDISFANQLTPPAKTEYYDAVRDAVQQSVNEAISTALAVDYNAQPQQEQSRSPPPTPYLRPVELWGHTYHRHESIAYRFEQSPSHVREQRLRCKRS